MDSIVDAEVGDLGAMCDLLGILFTQEADFTLNPRARQEAGLRMILSGLPRFHHFRGRTPTIAHIRP